MNMAQVKKYKNAPGPMPKKKWSYKGKEYEVDDEDLKMLNDWDMSNYEFDEILPNDYTGIPSGKDTLAKKIGLITENQFNTKYMPSPQEKIESSIITADKVTKPATADKKYGRFFRGSSSLEGQRAYDALYKANRNAGGWGMTNMALQAVEAGYDVYRGSDGSIVIKDSNGNDITKQFIPKGVTATVNDSQFRRNLGATFNTRNDRYRISGEYLDNIDMTPETVPDNRTELRRGSGWFTSIKDDKGNDIYHINGTVNQNNEEIIRNIIDFTLGNKTDMDAKYKYSAWQDADIAKLREYANEIASHIDENGQNTYANELINAIRSGNPLNEDQKYMLTLMGFDPNGTSSNNNNKDENEVQNLFQLEGVDSELLKNYGITGITKNVDENGNEYWTVEGDDKFKNSTWDLQGFGNIFGKFNNGWLHNGRLYTANDHYTNAALGNAVRLYLGNNASNINDWWTAAKQSGVRFFGDENESAPFINFNTAQNYDRSTEGTIWDFLRKNNLADKNIGIREVTAAYDPQKLNGRRLFAYVDTSDLSNSNRDGHRPLIKYFDNQGNVVNIESLGKELDFPGTNTTDFVFSNLDTSGTYINNMFTHGTYTNPKDGTQMTLMRDLNGNYHIYRSNPKDGTPLKPIAIHPSRVQEILDMIHNKRDWLKWRDIENFNKPSTNFSNTESEYPGYTKTVVQGVPYYINNTGTYVEKNGRLVKFRKEGGIIDWNRLSKLAPGGYISSTRQNVRTDDSKTSDITKTHAVDGSNGGLTKAEQLQVMGALADLGGVAASFAPGIAGGVAGGVTGLTGTALRFAGDVKRDGLDWGDIRRGLVNLAFDVAAVPASLLPGGDNVIKTSKFVKTIKNIGQPILKWMGTLGCSTALINTASKIINGEKYTSEDLTQLAQGLAGGIVAGKQWSKQIGDAKLASKLSERAATQANASFNRNVVINKDTKKTINIDELETIVKNAKGNEATIKEALKNKGASEDINLESLGITKGRRNIWEFITKKPAKSKYEKPTEQESNSFWHYFTRGSERAQALGNNKMFWQKKHSNLLNNISEDEYRLLMARGAGAKNYTISGAIRRAALNNPNSFNFNFDKVETVTAPWQFGWKNQYRTVAKPKEEITQQPLLVLPPYIAPTPTPTPIPVPTPTPTQVSTALVPFGSKSLTAIGPVSTAPKFRKPIITETHTSSGETIVTPPSTFKAIGARKTSVAPYGQIQYNSTNTGNKQSPRFNVNSIPKQNTLLGLEQLGKNAKFKEWANSHPKEAREFVAGLRRKFTNAKYKHKSSGEKDAYFNKRVNEMKSRFGWRFKKGGLIPTMQSGGFTGKSWKLNLNIPNTLDLAEAIISQNKLNKAYKYDQNAIKALKNYREQAVHLSAPTLDINDISQKYNAARNTLKSSVGPNTYADLALQEAANQAYGQQLVNLDMQEGSEKSNRIAQNKAETLNIINQNRTNDIVAANNNLKWDTQLNYQSEALKGQKIRDERANIWQPLSQQFRQQFRDMANKKASIQQQIDLDNLQQQQLLRDKTGIYKNIYEMYNKSGSSKGFSDWLASNDAAYKEYLKIRDSEEGKKYEATKRNEKYDIYMKYLPYSKNGGNIYKRKTAQEEIAINADKMSKKAVQKMNNNLMKMLLQLLK